MKITDLNTLGNLVKSGAPLGAPSSSAPKTSFSETMTGINRQNAEKMLNELSVEITKQGEIVGRRCDIFEMKRFREMITKYLHAAVSFMYEFKKQNAFDSKGRHKIYLNIKKINDNLEKMTEDILSSEASTINLLADVDEICGLLVNIML